MSPVAGSRRCSGPRPSSGPPKFAMTMRPARSMLMPFGAPSARPMRSSEPSARTRAQALFWSDSHTSPSALTTTSSGRATPVPKRVHSPRLIVLSPFIANSPNGIYRRSALQGPCASS